jgi:glycosyltransferase involved in cell wall biosynthesis
MLSGHPPGEGSGSAMRGAVALEALRSCCTRVDAVSMARSGEDAFADPAVILVERPSHAPPLARLMSLSRGGTFHLAERQARLGSRVSELIASGRLRPSYDVIWAHSSRMARVGLDLFEARRRVLDIDNVGEVWRVVDALPRLSPRRLFWQLNKYAISREEHRRSSAYDRVIVTSDAERERLGAARPDVTVVPNTLPSNGEPAEPAQAPPAILFVGSLDYEPNIDGLRLLVGEILPRVRAGCREASVTVAGRRPTSEVSALCRKAGAELVADAPSLDPLYRKARLVVAPIRLGGGTRIKVIEAMAYGAAIVATEAASEGLALEDDRNARLASDPAAFAAACVELLTRPETAGRLGAEAHETWRRYYRPEVARETITSLVEALCPTVT